MADMIMKKFKFDFSCNSKIENNMMISSISCVCVSREFVPLVSLFIYWFMELLQQGMSSGFIHSEFKGTCEMSHSCISCSNASIVRLRICYSISCLYWRNSCSSRLVPVCCIVSYALSRV